MTVSQIYEKSIKPLPEAERRELATLILADIPPQQMPGYSGEWSEEDMRALTAFSLAYAQTAYPEDEEIV